MRHLTLLLVVFLCSSCDYFNFREKEKNTSEIVAIVNTEKLFKNDLATILPKKISKQDSLLLVKSYIQNWAIKKLFLKKATTNSSLNDLNEIDHLVQDYKESLLINKYKEQLVKERLDTIITDVKIELFYNLNKQNFKLNEDLIKIKYLHFDDNIKTKDKEKFIKLFKSEKTDDIENLEKHQLSFKYHQFNDTVWMPLDNIMLKLPFSKDILLNKTKYLQKQDSLGLYLVAIKDVLQRNSLAPLSYIEPTIKQMILHKRKIELIREIEKTIIKDAIQNNNYKIY